MISDRTYGPRGHAGGLLRGVGGLRGTACGVALLLALCATASRSEPQGGAVVAGKATIEQNNGLVVNQQSKRAIIDWDSFSIGKGENVTFVQPSAKAAILNRVTGGDRSDILGSLTANGQVVLVNPNGIVFGESAKVDAAALIAAVANISNRDFMNGDDPLRFREPGPPASFVLNQGEITVGSEVTGPDGTSFKEGGLAAFVAPWVANSGIINARLGVVTLASGNRFTVDLFGDRLVQLAVKPTVMAAAFGLDGVEDPKALVTIADGGEIRADGGKVILDAGTVKDVGTVAIDVSSARSVVDNAINMEGLIEARTVDTTGGQIRLRGGKGTIGPIRVAGKFDASGLGANQSGGEIVFEGKQAVSLADSARFNVDGEVNKGLVSFDTLPTQDLAVSSDVVLGERLSALFADAEIDVTAENIPFVYDDEQPLGATVTVILEDAALAPDNTFGLYEVGNDVNRIELFSIEGATQGAQVSFRLTPNSDGGFSVSVDGETRGQLASRNYGYFLDTSHGARGGVFFSDRILNRDGDLAVHVGNYQIGGLSYTVASEAPPSLRNQQQPAGSRLLVWEDLALPLDAPEPDFNDFVVNVRADDPTQRTFTVIVPPEGCGADGRVDCVPGSGGGPGGPGSPGEGANGPGQIDPGQLAPDAQAQQLAGDQDLLSKSDPWNKCESWRDENEEGDPDVARCYAALVFSTLGKDANTAFTALAGALKDSQPSNRALAAEQLGKIGRYLSAATPVLLAALSTQDDAVAQQAATIIDDVSDYSDKVVPVLSNAAGNQEEALVARAALQGLGELGPYATAALPTFQNAFKRPDGDLGVLYHAANGVSQVDAEMRRTAAAIALLGGAYGDGTSAVSDLQRTLTGDRKGVRQDAIDVLAEIGPAAQAASRDTTGKLESSDPTVREEGVAQLGDINRFAAASVPVLVKAMADPENQELLGSLTRPDRGPSSYVSVAVDPLLQRANDSEPEVRQATAQALLRLNTVATGAELELKDVDLGGMQRDSARLVRFIRDRTLGTIADYDRRAIDVLLGSLKDDDPAVRRTAIQALGVLRSDAGVAVPDLIEAVKSGGVDLQIEAELALGRIGTDPATTIPTLVDALSDPSNDLAVRYRAAQALGLLSEKARDAEQPLRAAMDSADFGLRYQAAVALQAIDPNVEISPFALAGSEEETRRQVAELLAAAKGEDSGARVRLASIGPAAIPAIPEIVDALVAAPSEQRAELASLLRSISRDGLAEVPGLIETLQSGEPAARARAAERLGRISADAKIAVSALTEGLQAALSAPRENAAADDLRIRFALADALGELGNQTTATTRALVAAAADEANPAQVKREAQESLRREARAALEAEARPMVAVRGPLTGRTLYAVDRALLTN